MKDQFNRTIDYLRISITDQCNFRCSYCIPKDAPCQSEEDILSYEEILHIVKLASKSGIRKIKITGGEPLVRVGCCDLIRFLKKIEGIESVTLTTNGFLLDQFIDELVAAKVDAVNVSLDTLEPAVFQQITSVDGWHRVYSNILLLLEKGIRTKVNVVSFDTSEYGIQEEWKQFVELTREYPLDVRFIEVMPIGNGKKFKTLSHTELIRKIRTKYEHFREDTSLPGNGPAVYYKIDGFQGRIGFISAIHGKFCATCNRVRLTSTGFLKPCLCFHEGLDLRKYLREQCDDAVIEEAFRKAVYEKPQAHQFDNLTAVSEYKSMREIGG